MIITLCGSARFEKLFHLWNEVLTLSGHTVFGLSVYPSLKKGTKNWYSDEEKELLDAAHRRKIDASDAILVINHFAYVGESTLKEIKYARRTGKRLYALESWGIGSNHTLAYQNLAKKYKTWGFASPLDTFYPHFYEPWSLLPEADEFRSNLVRKIDDGRKL